MTSSTSRRSKALAICCRPRPKPSVCRRCVCWKDGWGIAWRVVRHLSYLLPYIAAVIAAIGLWSKGDVAAGLDGERLRTTLAALRAGDGA